VRLYLKRFVSRQFQRPMHDYRTVWRSFTQATARHLEHSELSRVVATLISDLFQVLSVSIWLVDDKREGLLLAASTSLSQSRDEELNPQGSRVTELIRALKEHPDPLDIDNSSHESSRVLRRGHPAQFCRGENRVSAPLMAGGEVLGLMMLGDRVGGQPFSVQEFDLLKCVADQTAASLLNIQLSQRLMQAREMEAFQTMSAFFVHDLKNSASTLSLMLQNLPVHFESPDFRQDALRSVSKTVTHINSLISRLGMLRENLAIRPIESDFNELVSNALKCLDGAANVEVVKGLAPLPKLLVDPEQIQKVVTNLALNAKEAMGGSGKIGVGTGCQNSWAVLSVSDNGCGMSREFVRRSLFRPFQTTKRHGIGIGMFQCKMIIEAHRGRIEVETELGKGTTFRVMLPLHPQVT
jgi:putative PEP-CTERM system histidine kinase